jgi:hypothetical protein
MTIVVTVRVNDGIVLASDSATSFFDDAGNVMKIYNNANKIFNLVREKPIGAMTYGAGGIGHTSMDTLSKDLRDKLTPEPVTISDAGYALKKNDYTIEEVAQKALRFFMERYQYAYPQAMPHYVLGYRICGYSAQSALPEAWEVRIVAGEGQGPDRLYGENDYGPRWAGESEALDRLLLGIGSRTSDALLQMGIDQPTTQGIVQGLLQRLPVPLWLPAMPIQDAIDLAFFLVDVASKFAYFSLRAPSVGGPIEVATITKHEGFKWIERKHYYSLDLNRQER